MRKLRPWLLLIPHLHRLWKSGQVRFRLETFGVYYPGLPYTRAPWHVSPRRALLLVRRLPAYVRWVAEMEELRRGGPPAWWTWERRNSGARVGTPRPLEDTSGHNPEPGDREGNS